MQRMMADYVAFSKSVGGEANGRMCLLVVGVMVVDIHFVIVLLEDVRPVARKLTDDMNVEQKSLPLSLLSSPVPCFV
jgi:hypothetical protein